MIMMTKRDKVRAQVKSRFYYMFWGTATLSVVAGQLYLGTSYRAMANSMNTSFEKSLEQLIHQYPNGTYERIVPPPSGDFRDYPPGIVFLNES